LWLVAVSRTLSSVQLSLARRGSDSQRGGAYSFSREDDSEGGGDDSKIGEVPGIEILGEFFQILHITVKMLHNASYSTLNRRSTFKHHDL
jgi:hypothetical protein